MLLLCRLLVLVLLNSWPSHNFGVNWIVFSVVPVLEAVGPAFLKLVWEIAERIIQIVELPFDVFGPLVLQRFLRGGGCCESFGLFFGLLDRR